MGIISLASGNSCWRGLDYYKNKKVIKLNKTNEGKYESVVKGTNNYSVHLDIEHPRKSTCDCPLANGKRIICKHIVATYFTALPKEAIKNIFRILIKVSGVLNMNIVKENNRVRKIEDLKIKEDTYKVFPVYYPVGNGIFNIDKSIEDIKWIMKNIERK